MNLTPEEKRSLIALISNEIECSAEMPWLGDCDANLPIILKKLENEDKEDGINEWGA